jgi:hypothetical protein
MSYYSYGPIYIIKIDFISHIIIGDRDPYRPAKVLQVILKLVGQWDLNLADFQGWSISTGLTGLKLGRLPASKAGRSLLVLPIRFPNLGPAFVRPVENY